LSAPQHIKPLNNLSKCHEEQLGVALSMLDLTMPPEALVATGEFLYDSIQKRTLKDAV
jgi:hypothetical protein